MAFTMNFFYPILTTLTIFSDFCNEKCKMHQNEGKMHQNQGKMDQNKGKMHQNQGKKHQNEGKMHQNESKVHQSKITISKKAIHPKSEKPANFFFLLFHVTHM